MNPPVCRPRNIRRSLTFFVRGWKDHSTGCLFVGVGRSSRWEVWRVEFSPPENGLFFFEREKKGEGSPDSTRNMLYDGSTPQIKGAEKKQTKMGRKGPVGV